MRRAFLFFVICYIQMALPRFLHGQPLDFYEHGHKITHYDDDQAIGRDVGDIWKDENGLLWMVNVGNLICFDGYDFHVYQPDEANRMNDARDQFQSVKKDNDGNIWLSSNHAGVVKYDAKNKTYKRIRVDPAAFSDFYTGFIEIDKLGNTWIEYTPGILRFETGKDDSFDKVLIRSLAEDLFPLIDSTSRIVNPVAELTKIRNNQEVEFTFQLNESQEVILIGQGELFKTNNFGLLDDRYKDHGWLTNEKGQNIWSMNPKQSYNAGGLIDNRINVDIISLPAGVYTLHYQTDKLYGYDEWHYYGQEGRYGGTRRNSPPSIPDWWGVQVIQSSANLKEKILATIAAYNSSDKLSSTYVHLHKDPNKDIWVYGQALEKLVIHADSTYGFEKYADWNLKNEEYNWNRIFGICDKDVDNFWMAVGVIDSEGVERIDIGTFNKTTKSFNVVKTGLPEGLRYYDLIQDNNANLWIGSYNQSGLFRLSPPFRGIEDSEPANVMKFELSEDDDPVRRIKIIEIDDFNNLWVGTHQMGLYKINLDLPPFNYTNLKKHEAFKDKSIHSVQEDSRGNMWFTTLPPISLVRYHPDKGVIASFTDRFKGIPFEHIVFVTELPNRNLLFQTESTFIEFDIDNDRAIKRNVAGADMTSQARTRASAGRGFMLNDSLLYIPGYLIDIDSWSVRQDLDGLLEGSKWLGKKSGKDRLWLFRSWGEFGLLDYSNNPIDFISKNVSFANNLDLLEDTEGELWYTNNFNLKTLGLGSKPARAFSANNDFQKAHYVAKFIEHGDDIWHFSDLGSSGIHKSSQEVFHAGELSNAIIIDAYKNTNEKFVLLDANGFYVFNPDLLQPDSLAPQVIINTVLFGDQQISTTNINLIDPLQLSYHQNDLTVDYVGLQYNNPEETKYAYRLKGLNEDWQEVGKERKARFLNLSPNEYTFSIKAANGFGVWSEPQDFSFNISPPWWHSTIARILYGLFGIGALFSFYQYRMNKLKKERNDEREFAEALIYTQEEERRRIARDLHDGVGQSLLLIKKQLGLTASSTKKNQELISKTLEEVRTISINLHPFQLEKFGLTSTIEDMLAKVQKSTEMFITKDIQNIDGLINAKDEIHVFRVIQEAFSNILKHAEATAAKIEVAILDRSIKIDIKDNGKGFDAYQVQSNKGMGLKTMKERISAVGGEIKFEKGLPKGTYITVVIPLRNNKNSVN